MSRITVRSVLISLVALVVAGFAFHDAAWGYFTKVEKSSAPTFVQIDPAYQLEARAQGIDPVAPSLSDADQIASLAQLVLRRDPLDADAIRLLGLARSGGGAALPQEYLQLAQTVSRRDLQTQLGLLALAAQKNDHVQAVAHLDRALAVRPRVLNQIAPYLVAILGDPDGREAMSAYVERPWFDDFVKLAAPTTDAPQNLARALLEKPAVVAQLDRPSMVRLIDSTARRGYYTEARALASRLGLQDEALQSFEFSNETVNDAFKPLTWDFKRTPEVEAILSTRGYAEITLFSDQQSLALERMTTYPAGTRKFSIGAEQSGGVEPRGEWRLSCIRDGKPVMAANYLFAIGRSDNTSDIEMAIPANCATQLWSLWLRDDSRDPAAIRFWISQRG